MPVAGGTTRKFENACWAVLHDESQGTFRCLYEDAHYDFDRIRDTNVDITDPRVAGSRICYAQSTDGLNWTKPALEYLRVGGQATNVVFGDWDDGREDFGSVHAIAVLDDAFEDDPARRFKMIFQHVTAASPDTDVATDPAGRIQILQSPIRMAFSPDAIHWTADQRRLDFGGLGPRLGDVIELMQDPASRRYVLYTRHPNAWNPPLNPKNPVSPAWSLPYYPQDPARQNKRRIWRCESTDLILWDEPYEVLVSDDEEDGLDESFNSLCPMRIGDLLVGFATVLRTVSCEFHVQLVYSRDGKDWHRADKRQPIIPIGGPDDWDSCLVSVPSVPVERGDELWIYYGGANHHHNWWLVGRREGLDLPEVHNPTDYSSGMGLAVLRKEGFASLSATIREGIIVTRPMRLTGRRLLFNAACGPDGYLDIEVADDNDDVVAGLARDDFVRFTGDATRAPAAWREATPLPVDRDLKLRFFLRHCDLYSICSDD